MNSERYELMKSGQLQFSHPSGTHDDSPWALALAVYASRPERPVCRSVVLTGYIVKPTIDVSALGGSQEGETTFGTAGVDHMHALVASIGKEGVSECSDATVTSRSPHGSQIDRIHRSDSRRP